MTSFAFFSVCLLTGTCSFAAASYLAVQPCPGSENCTDGNFDLHHLDLDPKRDSWGVLVFVLHLLGLALSLASNGSIVTVVVRTSQLHTPSSVPILALVVSDLLLSLVWHLTMLAHGPKDLNVSRFTVGEPTTSADEASGNVSHAMRHLLILEESRTACHIVGFLWQTLMTTSTLFQAAVACDRYLFIVHPLRYESFITNGKASIVLLILAILALMLPAASLLSGGTYSYLLPAATCVSHMSWYVLFIAFVFLPSFAVTLASNIGIWSLCVRQLNTPGRTRLVREVAPYTHAFNLEENNGRVSVRRDIADEFSCCIPALRRSSAGARGDGDRSPCLSHLVQNSSLMFIEGFFAAVPKSVPVDVPELSEEDDDLEAPAPSFVCPEPPTVSPPSPNRFLETHEADVADTPSPSDFRSELNNLFRAEGVSRFGCDFLTPTPLRKPVSSPSAFSTRSASGRRNFLRRTPSFQVERVIKRDSPNMGRKTLSNDLEAGRNRLSTGVCSILKSSTVSIEAIETLELSMRRVGSNNLQVVGLSPSPSMHSNNQMFFRSTSTSSAGHRSMQEQASPPPSPDSDETSVMLSAVVNPIAGWILRAQDEPEQKPKQPAKSPVYKMLPTFFSSLAVGLGIGLGRNVDLLKQGASVANEATELEPEHVLAMKKVPIWRWAKAALLVSLPVISLVLTVLPLVVVQTLWVAGVSLSHSAIAWVCHIMYIIMPPFSSFLMGLTNRHLRRALSAILCCPKHSL